MKALIRPPLAPSPSQGLQTENKYTAPAHRAKLALRILQRNCDPDGKYPVSVISSIYYDTPDWKLLGEKRDSDYLKTKIRLRWYEDTMGGSFDSDSTYAEAKYRIGSKRMKYRIQIEMLGAEVSKIALNDPILRTIPDKLAAKGAIIPQPLLPAFIVRYERHRFVDRLSGTRISLDFNIGSPRTNPMMIATPFPCRLPVLVLEVKGTHGAFPPGLRSLLKLGFRKAAFSKYYECYARLMQTLF